ncbi:MAG: hypothetical protein WC861_05650 [Candidatus Micrarchaeia archaeon]|jgi:hypothetical protein
MHMPLLAHAPDRNRLAIIAERCLDRKMGPILVSPFFKSPAGGSEMESFNTRMSCFYQALCLNDVKPLLVTKSEDERAFIANWLHANGSMSWSLFLPLDRHQKRHLSSLALETGQDRVNGIRYHRSVVEKVQAYAASHDAFVLAGTKGGVDIALPSLESYLARIGMAKKEIHVEEYLVYPPLQGI